MARRTDNPPLLLDGAMGSELERRGCDTSLPLWSARALMDAPEMVEQIHIDYLDAGADLITTNTFRTHRRSLAKAGLGGRARELTFRAVEIAQRARDAVNPAARLCGSVSPLEDCYEPDLAPPFDVCAREDDEMIAWLMDAGVDLILIETMNNVPETLAAIECAARHAPSRWMVSCCVQAKDLGPLQRGSEITLLSGEAIDPVISAACEAGAFAIGINCVPAPWIASIIQTLRRRVPTAMPLIAYANVGRADPVKGWINTDAVDPGRYAEYAMQWIDAGATIVGGCCGTTPDTIRAMRSALSVRSPQSH